MSGIHKMGNLNRSLLWQGCILAGIAHAISNAVEPMFSYEHSWDNGNYSVQDSAGKRGTVSFHRDGYCVAAFRDEHSRRLKEHANYLKYFEKADKKVLQFAKEEALQYLLDEYDGNVQPVITTAFWGDRALYSQDVFCDMMENGGNLLEVQMSEPEEGMKIWRERYEFQPNQAQFMEALFEKKVKDPYSTIELPVQEISVLGASSKEGIEESRTSFAEMGIYWV